MDSRGHLGRALSLRGEEGSELVEFALVLIPLALFLFGIIQWGLIFAANMTLRNASVIAARYATLGPTNQVTQAQVRDKAKQAVAPLLDPDVATATVNLTNVAIGSTTGSTGTSVRVDYNLRLIIPWVVLGTNVSNGHIALSATTVMR